LNIVLNTDTATNVLAVLPEILVTILAVSVVLLDAFWPESRRRDIGTIAAVGLFVIAAITLGFTPPSDVKQQLVLGGMIRFDTMKQLFAVITLVASGIACLISMDVPNIGRRGEFYAVIMIATLGACLISGAADLIMVFVGLETLSISLYVLSGFLRDNKRSSEAGIKYFLFGAFTSTVMLYGMSLLYGFTGHTNLYAIGQTLATLPFKDSAGNLNAGVALPIVLAMLTILVGFGFKVSAVPFHFWTPDVYEGAPTPVTAYISVASKAASFALLTRFMIIVFQGATPTQIWVQIIAILAVVTMSVGNLLALPQRNIKRLIAYSSIAQAGYTLVGVAAIAASSPIGSGAAAVGYYMAMYVFTNLAAFGAIILFTNATGSETIADLAGLSRRNLPLSLVLTVALLSLAGIPPAAGFIGKFFLFKAAVNADLTWLAIIGVLNSIVALYYYLVVIKIMFVDRSEDENKPIPMSTPYVIALALSAIAVILLGIIATPIFDAAAQAAKQLFL
jgi:NADH-quinone oxidoreductase subunit N